MNLDHIKSESLRHLDLKHSPLSNMEDFNEYGLSSPPTSDSAEPQVVSTTKHKKRLRRRSESASSSRESRRQTLSKSQAPIIPTMEVLHSVDEDMDSNSNFQSSSSEPDIDGDLETMAQDNEGGDDGIRLFRQYSARQRKNRRRKGSVSDVSSLDEGSDSMISIDDHSTNRGPPALARSATVRMGRRSRSKRKTNGNTKGKALNIPGSTHLHHRSFSESALSRTMIQNQWPSTCSSEEEEGDIYDRFLLMKKKYHRQRAISKQFQEAITCIQDDNEDHILQNEQQIRDSMEQKYEIKLMQLEQQKLGSNLQTEIKIKTLQSQNDELLERNKQLQHQLAAQVGLTQQQQQMTMQMQAQLQRTKSDEYAVCSPMSATAGPLPRMNSLSSVISAPPTLPGRTPTGYGQSHYSPMAINSPSMDTPYSVHGRSGRSRHTPGPSISSMGSSVDDYTLNAVTSSNDGSNASTDELQQIMASMVKNRNSGIGGNGHFRSSSTASSVLTVEGGGGATEMTEPPTAFSFSAVQAAKLRKKRKKKRMRDLERRLKTKDYDEKRKAMRDGLTAWDRFIDLMTPSFCSCSPAQPPSTSMVARKVAAQ